MKALKILTVIAVLVGSTQAFAAITNSKHDLSTSSSNGGIRAKATSGVDEICVFCHTPHGANTSFTGAPIWNKEDATATTFTMYGSTLAGTAMEANVSDSSKACLSCHDGVSAVNSLQNSPGSGLIGDLGDMTGKYADMVGGTGAQTIMDLGGDAAVNIGDGSGTTADLSNDHPISVQYTEGKASLRAKSYVMTNWTTPSGGNTIADVLKGGSETVECGTCHDPHLGENPTFLRMTNGNVNSQLCLTCHAK